MRTVVLCLAVVGCANPISNEAFYQDEAFLAALPSSARLGVPEVFLGKDVGDAPIWLSARSAAAELDQVVTPMIASGEILRGSPPDERSDSVLAWEGVSVAAETGPGTVSLWWVRGTIARPEEGSDLDWSVEIAGEATGPWIPVGSGRHDPGGYGTMTWDLEAGREVVVPARSGMLDVDYDDGLDDNDELGRHTTFTISGGTLWQRAVAGDFAIAWNADFSLTTDGNSWPGACQAIHDTWEGGRALGEVFRPDDSVPFEACWGRKGQSQWIGGEADVAAFGAPSACSLPDPW